jgi:hypothetical protein
VCQETFVLDTVANEEILNADGLQKVDQANSELQTCTCEPGYAVYPDVALDKCTPCKPGTDGMSRVKEGYGTDPRLCEAVAVETDTTSIMMIAFIIVAGLVPMVLLYAFKSGSIAEDFFSSFALEAIMSVALIGADIVDIITDIVTWSYVSQFPLLKTYQMPYTLLVIFATVGGTAALGFKVYVLKAAYSDALTSNTAYQVAPAKGQELQRQGSSFSGSKAGQQLLIVKKKQLASLHRDVVTAIAGIISFLVEDGPLAVLNINILLFLQNLIYVEPETIQEKVAGVEINQLLKTICTSLFINLIGFGIKVAILPWLKELYTKRKHLQADIDAITADPDSNGAVTKAEDIGPSPMRVLAA